MSSIPILVVLVLLIAAPSGIARGQAPFVDSLFVPRFASGDGSVMPPGYRDIVGSEKTVALPAGTALISWSVSAEVHYGGGSSSVCRVRPVIGSDAPTEGPASTLEGGFTVAQQWNGGQWTTQTPGGAVTVKLQVACEVPGVYWVSDERYNSLTWSLVVYPQTNNNIPAVGGIGLLVMAATLIGLGGVVIRRRRVGAGAPTYASPTENTGA